MIEVLKWVILGALLLIQLWGLFRKKTLSRKQLTVKLSLNVLLWLALLLFMIQTKWQSSENHASVLVYSDSSKTKRIKEIQDSLKIKRAINYKDFKQKWSDFANREIYLLGQDAEPELLSNLSEKSVSWIPDLGEIKELNWEGIIRRGSLQIVSGKIEVENPATLKIKYADQTLDSLKLDEGFTSFDLKFPVFSEGRNEVGLFLGETELQKIRFFVIPSAELSVLLLLENPDFESKVLAEWLGRQGYKVQVITEVAKSSVQQSDVNVSKKVFSPDVFITTTSMAGDSRVKKAGKNVFFMGLAEPVSESQLINRNLGTQFSLKRISSDDAVVVDKDLTALPYQFNVRSDQRVLKDLPVAYQKKKVVLSLLNETFPLKLAGDSIQYDRIWAETFALFSPFDSLSIQAPIFKDVSTEIRSVGVNDLYPISDSLSLSASVINPESKSRRYRFREAGWQKVNDSLEVFVEDANAKSYLEEWLINNRAQSSTSGKEMQTVPNRIWFLIVLLCLTALWVEPKVRY